MSHDKVLYKSMVTLTPLLTETFILCRQETHPLAAPLRGSWNVVERVLWSTK